MVNVSCKELNAELTREELEELENAAARTIKYDEDKAYGKGYTSFLSRLIDAALDDDTLVKKCL